MDVDMDAARPRAGSTGYRAGGGAFVGPLEDPSSMMEGMVMGDEGKSEGKGGSGRGGTSGKAKGGSGGGGGVEGKEGKEGVAGDSEFDCYPYTFSPLLLFAQSSYFDAGFSNYNSVAQFFTAALPGVNMLENVLYDRKNMLYEALITYVTDNRMFVPLCIDAHCTAIQVLGPKSLLYYDPLSSSVTLVEGSDAIKYLGFLLLKCNLGDSQHMQDNKSHYVGNESNNTRKMLYSFWKEIHKMKLSNLRCRTRRVPLDLQSYLLVNGRGDPSAMSTQQTGNTCYFQTYLFAVLCKVGGPSLAGDGRSVKMEVRRNGERRREAARGGERRREEATGG